MTKKDYQSFARLLHNYSNQPYPVDQAVFVRILVDDIAGIFKADNPRFDRSRFIEACETGTCKGMKA